MSDLWQIRVYDNQQPIYSGQFSGKVELGRQSDPTERLCSRKFLDKDDCWRLVVAGRDEDSVSRRHALLTPTAAGRARVENLSAKVAIGLPDGRLDPGQSREAALPLVLVLGRKTVRIQEGLDEPPLPLQGLKEATAPPMASASGFATIALPQLVEQGENVGIEEIIQWLQAMMVVLQAAAGSSEFFAKAAQAVVEAVGLDSGTVLLLEQGEWTPVAQYHAPGQAIAARAPSRQVLGKVERDRRTFFLTPQQNVEEGAEGASLVGLSAVVAAPILNERGRVIGALYGDRRISTLPGVPPQITKVDAMLVELLASGVATGLARQEQERAAASARVQFEQFFTPQLAHVIANRPELLEGQDAEISVLFCDIRGFSRVAERLGPAWTVKWINNVMGTLSDCVLAHNGVLVDYIGDMIMAMWGAPETRPDHAQLACQAAIDMMNRLPELNAVWEPTLGEKMDVGIGINTGVARVGNTGSYRKFKYGPLGNTVNLASRVEGLTKHLKARLLVTSDTQKHLGPEFPARRIGLVRVVNIQEPVELHELFDPELPGWQDLKREYELALEQFERQEFRQAAKTLGSLMPAHPDDRPSLVLMSRVVNCMVDPEAFNPVFEPKSK